MDVKYFCVGHKAPLFSPNVSYDFFCSEVVEHQRLVYVPDRLYGEVFDGGFLSEYAQLISIVEYLKAAHVPLDSRIYLFQYRKFLSIDSPNVKPALNNWWSYPVDSECANSLFPDCEKLDCFAGDYIVGPKIKVQSLADNYFRAHHGEDFISFVLALKETVFDCRTCDEFSKYQYLIPAPSLGLFSVRFIIETVELMMRAWVFFYKNFYIKREGYQRRCGGFLLERLNSFLLLKAIEKHPVSFTSGYQIIVSDTNVIQCTV